MMRIRRTLLALLIALLSPPVSPQAPPRPSPTAAAQEAAHPDPFRKDEVDRSLERACAYLVREQKPGGEITDKARGSSNGTAMSSLAVMAMASLGHQPGDPSPEGQALRKALDFVLRPSRQDRNKKADGYFGGADGSRMYGHGITTLMLAEMLGMGVDDEQDVEIRRRLDPAIDLVLRSQKIRKDKRYAGGWRYTPASRDADLSVTVWQVMALRSAKNAGLDVPKDAVDAAAGYIRRSYRLPNRGSGSAAGGKLPPAPFAYQPGSRAEFSTAAAGLLALQVCGFYEDPTVRGAADWLLENGPKWGRNWFFYGLYYYAQGMYQRGGRHAELARRMTREALLAHQQKDGSWRAPGGQEASAGKVYATSLAILSLSVKYHYLPIYQR